MVLIESSYTISHFLNTHSDIVDQAAKKRSVGIEVQMSPNGHPDHKDFTRRHVNLTMQHASTPFSIRKEPKFLESTGWKIPVLCLYPRPVFGESFNLSRQSLSEILESHMDQTDFGDLGRPISVCTGANRGTVKHALARYWGVPRKRLRRLSEHPIFGEGVPGDHASTRILAGEVDLVFTTGPVYELELKAHVVPESEISVARVDGHTWHAPDYELVSDDLHIATDYEDLLVVVTDLLNDSDLREAAVKAGFSLGPISRDPVK